MNDDKNTGTIPVEVARQMVDAYTQYSKECPAEAYTKAVWFPLEQIERIYNSLKERNSDGLRVYFGQYTKEAAAGLPDYYIGRNTVIFVPTTKAKGYGDPIHDDDLGTDPENKGEICPQACDGTAL
ncbi:hypothetical protein [Pedobacter paludis]|uniref:Uncharacterized protein n=1 Tax=Pedobacter paludis TaxID=2203212 RepID=A0A317F2M0_9SPHI|nr:hypothetical protein [Pedobacter paludis]PWS32079.1 hypothetical protein DF947_09900 [Pedobacter paludis]